MVALNGALVVMRLRERYWAVRLSYELRRWDGRLPSELEDGAGT